MWERDAMVPVNPVAFVLFVLLSYAEDWTQSLSQARQVLFLVGANPAANSCPHCFKLHLLHVYVEGRVTGTSVEVKSSLLAFFHHVGSGIELRSPGLVNVATSSPLPTPVSLYWSWQPPEFAPQGCGLDFLIPVLEYRAPAALSRPWDNCEAFGHCRQKPVLSERRLGQSTSIAISDAFRANCLFGKRGCLDLVS